MMMIYDCDAEEANAFRNRAKRLCIRLDVRAEALTAQSAARAPIGCAVCVSHKLPVDESILSKLRERGVRYICTRSVGTDHIDTECAERLGIMVDSVSYSPESVAEHTIMLMLMALRGAAESIRNVKRNDFRLPNHRANTLMNSTVGIIGTGNIGRCVARRLRGFGCKVIGYDPYPTAELRYVPLETLLMQSDIVTLHLPLTDSTRHIIDREALAIMKRGAYLVNAARGALVDTDALADAIEIGRIAGAALDVVEGEGGWFYNNRTGDAPFARLMQLPNVVITPHSAFYTRAALSDIVENTLSNYLKFEEGSRKWIV